MSILCDGQIYTNNIEEFGETIIIRQVEKTSFNRWGDANESITDNSNIKSIPWILSQEDEYVKEGQFKAGMIIFLFDNSNQSLLARGNRIQYDSTWYEITSVKKIALAGTNYTFECFVKKI